MKIRSPFEHKRGKEIFEVIGEIEDQESARRLAELSKEDQDEYIRYIRYRANVEVLEDKTVRFMAMVFVTTAAVQICNLLEKKGAR